jgi:hypothetical protein
MSTRVTIRQFKNLNKITLKMILPHQCSNTSCAQQNAWTGTSEKCPICLTGRCVYLYIDEKWRQCSSYLLNQSTGVVTLRIRNPNSSSTTVPKRTWSQAFENGNSSNASDSSSFEEVVDMVEEMGQNWTNDFELNFLEDLDEILSLDKNEPELNLDFDDFDLSDLFDEPQPKLQKNLEFNECKIEEIEPTSENMTFVSNGYNFGLDMEKINEGTEKFDLTVYLSENDFLFYSENNDEE